MSEPFPALEVEHEWCSAATLSAIPAAPEPGHASTMEPTNSPAKDTANETMAGDATGLPPSDQLPPARTFSKSRSSGASSRSTKSSLTTNGQKLVAAMRSRRSRIVAAVVGVLFIVGLTALNWSVSGSTKTSAELTEMDLSEFNDDFGFDTSRNGDIHRLQPLGELAGTGTMSTDQRFLQNESRSHLPPLGLVNHADHTTASSGIQPAGGFVPASAGDSRGAWLTGQIETDSRAR